MNSSIGFELFTSRGCRRYEAQGMKLWSFTANPLQQSRSGCVITGIKISIVFQITKIKVSLR